jgi:hypothetical protein
VIGDDNGRKNWETLEEIIGILEYFKFKKGRD